MRMSRCVAPLLLVLFGLGLAAPSGAIAAPATVAHDTPFDFFVFNSCSGEDVHIVGTGHTVDQFSVSASGNVHLLHQESVADILAIGMTSGTVYNPTGQPAREVFNFNPATISGPYSFINRQLFITPGNTDNFVLREKFHVEKTPNGDFTVILDTLSIECRG